MGKLKFVVPHKWQECSKEIEAMSRQYMTTVEFRLMTIDHPGICKVLKKFDMQFKVLILDEVTVDADILKKLIGMFQLEKLIINRETKVVEKLTSELKETIDHGDGEKMVKIPTLSLLSMANPAVNLMKLLAEMGLQSKRMVVKIYEIGFLSRDRYDVRKQLTDFMHDHRTLQNIDIKAPATMIDIITNALRPLKIVKLAICLTDHQSRLPPDYSGLAELIKSQPTLKELDICCESIAQDSIDAIYQTKNLQKLKLEVELLPSIIKLPTPCKSHKNLKSLITVDLVYSEQSLDALLQMFANIEVIGINCESSNLNSSDIISNSQNRLKSLQELTVPEVTDHCPSLAITHLRKLRVHAVSSVEGLRSFLAVNPQLQKLEIEFICDFTTSIALSRESINLRRLFIGSSVKVFKIDENVLRGLKGSCPSLTRLEFVHSGSSKISVAGDIVDFSSIKVVKMKKKN